MKLGIVVPCYNEEDVLEETSNRLFSLLIGLIEKGKIENDSRIYFVDDGSRDKTWTLIKESCARDQHFCGIKLAKNRGHQNALLAGLFMARGDALITIDADLQDDIFIVEAMVEAYLNDFDIVYGVRKKRQVDNFFKRFTAELFYKIIRMLTGSDSIDNHADFRLMSRRAIENLKQYKEVNLYLRGLVPLLGFNSKIVYYDREKRYSGESKYPIRRMISLALDAVTSFSVIPLRIITLIGFLTFLGSMSITLWVLWTKYFTNFAIPGWASTVLPMYFLGGVQILCIGVLGEYMGKIYSEVKARPRYIISDMKNF
ncbi:MAG: glycosyltransferase family 2 protein [Epsilonproteobacteria bacterium]|nr:glycosyltransferase family 2 protein [Campylobacterota bacterium]